VRGYEIGKNGGESYSYGSILLKRVKL